MNTFTRGRRLMARIAVAIAIALATPAVSRGTLLVYESFNYATGTASGSGVLLNGQNGGTGMTGSWTTVNTGTANSVTNYLQPNLSGVNLSTGVANTFNGTVTNLPTSGGYFGSVSSAGGGTTTTTDHIYAYRTLDPSVTATFTAGSTTWFSFVSARAFSSNATGPKFAIGAGRLSTTDRGQSAQGEAIGAGGGLGTNAGSNTLKVYGQFWDQAVAGTGSYQTYDATGSNPLNSSSTTALNTNPDFPPLQAFTWASDSATFQPIANIVIGKIQWNDGTPDVLTVARFLPTSGTLTEALFDASALPSSTTWPVQPDLDQSKFNTISFAGARYFADEVRIATTFDEVVGLAVVPEPTPLAALAAGLAAAVAFCCRRRGRRVISLPLAAVLLAASIGSLLHAADYTWDDGVMAASRDPPITPNGNGIWSVTRTVDTVLVPGSYNWTAIDAVTLQPVPAQWINGTTTTNGNTAVFASGSPTPWGVNIDGTVTAAGLTFNGPATIGSFSGTPGTDSLRFTANGATMTVSVAAGVTGTVTADVLPNNTAVDQSNVLVKTGAGTLTLAGTTRLATSSGNHKSSYFTVNGGGTLQINGRFISTNDTATQTAAQCPPSFIGNTSSNNTIRVTGNGTVSMWTNAITFGGSSGGSSFDNNSLILAAAGSATTPTWTNFGSSPQVNMVSSGNLLKIESGAYLKELGSAGTPQWTIGTNVGNNGNSIIVDGAGSTLAKTNGAIWIGAAGGSNALIVRNGGTFNGGSKINIGMNGGDDNYQLITGSGSAQNAGFGSNNTWLQIGVTSGSLRNSLRVENGGVLYLGGNSNDRTNGVGWVAGANDNYIKVSGAGSIYKFIHLTPLVIGGQAKLVSGVPTITDGGTGNHLDVVDGGRLDLDNSSGVDPKAYSGSTYLALAGTGSTFNLGNGSLGTGDAMSTVVLGKISAYGSGLGLRNSDSVLRINVGRVVAGTTLVSNDTLISGPGSVVLDGPAYFSIPAGVGLSRVTSPISGTGSLTKEGDGVLLLSNTHNSYSGNTTISAGTLQITAPFLSNTSSLTIGNNALIDLNFDGTNTVGGLVVDGETMPNGFYTAESMTVGGRPFINGIGALMVVWAVPEPGSMLLAAAAAGAVLSTLGLRRRRRLR